MESSSVSAISILTLSSSSAALVSESSSMRTPMPFSSILSMKPALKSLYFSASCSYSSVVYFKLYFWYSMSLILWLYSSGMVSHGCLRSSCALGRLVGSHWRMGSIKSANISASCFLNRYFCISSLCKGKWRSLSMFLKTNLPVASSRL